VSHACVLVCVKRKRTVGKTHNLQVRVGNAYSLDIVRTHIIVRH